MKNVGGVAPLTDPIRGTSEPNRLWTLTNVGEATPDILSPLCWALWGAGVEFASRGGLYDFGVLPRSALRVPNDPNQWSTACFFGRQAMNVDRARELAGLLPGMTGDDFERDLLGSVRPDATPTKSDPARLPIVAVKAPIALARERTAPRRMHAAQMRWWRSTVLAGNWTDSAVLLADSAARFCTAMRVHVRTRLILNALRSRVTSIAERLGRNDLVPALLAGYGGVIETALADDVWSLGRGKLEIGEFLMRHGFHGPNEGNVIGHSWREDPSAVLRAAGSHAARSDDERPLLRAKRAVAARERAEKELLTGLSAVRRSLLRRLLRFAGVQVRSVELTKAAFLTAIDGCRAAASTMGQDLAAAGILARPDDTFYLTVDELTAPLPTNVRELVDFRRARREEYRHIEIPTCSPVCRPRSGWPTEPVATTVRYAEHPLAPGFSREPCESSSTRIPRIASKTARYWCASSSTPAGPHWFRWPGHSSPTSAAPRATVRSSRVSWASPVSWAPVTALGRCAPETSYVLTE